MLIPLLYAALVISCWTFALIFGGRTAQWAFLFFVMTMVGTMVSTNLDPSFELTYVGPWDGFNWLLATSDACYFIAMTVISLRSRRFWPIWSAGLQFACVLTHFGPFLDHHSSPKLYRALETIWAIPIMGTMVLGIAKDRRRERHGRPNDSDQGRGD